MALRCTVFGHRWGETGMEREREEEGSEVVVTVREVRTCDRCGAEDVLGESMEVTALDQPDPEPEPAAGEPDQPRGTPEGTDQTDYDGETDDGVILDEGGGERDRDPREWPERPEHERADDEPGEPRPWPETAREDETTAPDEERFVGAEEAPPAPDPLQPERDGDGGAEIIDADAAPPDDATGDSAAADDAPARDEPAGVADDASTGDATPPRPDREDAGSDGDPDAPEHAGDEGGQAGTAAGGTDADEDDPESGRDRASAGPDRTAVGGDRRADRDVAAGADAGVDDADGPEADEPAAMGPDATRRPDDDAEVLEATEPTEQSRVTARDPVDPDAAGGAPDGPGGADRSSADDGAAGGPRGSPGEGATAAGGGDERGPSPEHIEFYCPECGFVDDSEWPSRRAGDICPDCQRSYLAERET